MHIYYFMPKELLERELVQAKEEGKDISGISADLDGEEALKAVDELQNRPVSKDFPFDEPDTLDDIRAKRPHHVAKPALALNDEVLLDKILGAWLGRSSGCWLGKPWEGFGMAKGKDGIKNVLVDIVNNRINLFNIFQFSKINTAESTQ